VPKLWHLTTQSSKNYGKYRLIFHDTCLDKCQSCKILPIENDVIACSKRDIMMLNDQSVDVLLLNIQRRPFIDLCVEQDYFVTFKRPYLIFWPNFHTMVHLEKHNLGFLYIIEEFQDAYLKLDLYLKKILGLDFCSKVSKQ